MQYIIVDDHVLVTSAVSMLLEDKDENAKVFTASSSSDALKVIDEEGDNTDLLILDLGLPGVQATELMEEIVRRQPLLKILVLSGSTDRTSIMRVLQLGAAGFVPKSFDPEMLSTAIDFVLKGGVFIPTRLLSDGQREGLFQETTERLRPQTPEVHLTERQRDVLQHLAKGAPIKRICLDLNLSEGTVKTHVSAIYRAFGATNRTEALLAARRAGYNVDV